MNDFFYNINNKLNSLFGKTQLNEDANPGVVPDQLDELSKEMERNEINELSKDTLGNYVKKASRDAGEWHAMKDELRDRLPSQAAYSRKKMEKRHQGVDRAVDRLTKEDQLDELSSDTLKSYAKKAEADAEKKHHEAETGSNTFDRLHKQTDSLKRQTGALKANTKAFAKGELDERAGPVEKKDWQKHFNPNAKSVPKSTTWGQKLGLEEGVTRDNIESLRDIVTNHSARSLKFDDGTSMMVDVQTADVILKVYEHLNPDNQAKLNRMVNKDKSSFVRIVDFCWTKVAFTEDRLDERAGPVDGRDWQQVWDRKKLEEGVDLDPMIDQLKSAYNSLETIDPASPTYKKLIKLLDSLDDENLQLLANAGVKFVSGLAKNRVKRRGLTELSKDTLGSYAKQAKTDMTRQGAKWAQQTGNSEVPFADKVATARKINNRDKGIDRAVDRLVHEEENQQWEVVRVYFDKYTDRELGEKVIAGPFDSKEEARESAGKDDHRSYGNKTRTYFRPVKNKQLDELSPRTLGSYAKAATDDAIGSGERAGVKIGSGKGGATDDFMKAAKRKKGIGRAVDRLALGYPGKHDDWKKPNYNGHLEEDVGADEIWLELWKEYEKNEDRNNHSENVILIADAVGSDEDKKLARDILKRHHKVGHLEPKVSEVRTKLFNKLWPLFEKEVELATDNLKGGNTLHENQWEDVVEAVSAKDAIDDIMNTLNDPKKMSKFKGDKYKWTGPKKGDYGYPHAAGHGMGSSDSYKKEKVVNENQWEDWSWEDVVEAALSSLRQGSTLSDVIRDLVDDGLLQHNEINKLADILKAQLNESKKKPSAGLSKEKKSATVKKAKSGGDIGKKGKSFDKVSSKAAKKYGSKEAGEKVAAAAMWKNIHREDINEAETETFTVKYKMNKAAKKISVAEYDSKEAADKFLASVKAEGGNGIVSKKVNESSNDNLKDDHKVEYKKTGDGGHVVIITKPDGQRVVHSGKDLNRLKKLVKDRYSKDPTPVKMPKINETDQLDELSPKTLASYRDKAVKDAKGPRGYGKKLDNTNIDSDEHIQHARKRLAGAGKADDKITAANKPKGLAGKIKGMFSEDDMDEGGVRSTARRVVTRAISNDPDTKKALGKEGVKQNKQISRDEHKKASDEDLQKVVDRNRKSKSLPEKVKEEGTDSSSGSSKKVGNNTMFGTIHKEEADVTGPEKVTVPKLGDDNVSYGGGVYESLMKGYRNTLTEGISVNVNVGKDSQGNPTKNISINADGEDAEALAQLLSLAGLDSGSVQPQPELDIEVVGENKPDWPTNTETSNDAFQYSGGLNKPKVTGQTTVPVIAGQTDRMGKTNSMYEDVELERSLFGLFKDYKGDDE